MFLRLLVVIVLVLGLPTLIDGQSLFNGTCRLEQISATGIDDSYYHGVFYVMVLDFSGPLNYSRTEDPADPDINWYRVRARMRITSSRAPQYDLITAKELFYGLPSNPYVLSGNTLRIMVGVTLEEGENITVRYWQPPIATTVDLLVGGVSAPSFECTATMPVVTRLVSQVTVYNYLYQYNLPDTGLPEMAIQTIMLTFSRPVVRCDTGGELTPDNFFIYRSDGFYDSLSVLCSGMEPLYDQQTWRCTGFSYSFVNMEYVTLINDYYAKYIQPTGVCDRERNSTAVADSRYCWDASLTSNRGALMVNMLWFGQNWVFDPAARTMVYQYESCGSNPPLNGSSPTPIYFQGGLSSVSSTYSWFPVSVLPVDSGAGLFVDTWNYSIVYSPLDINFTVLPYFTWTPTPILYQAFTNYRPQILLQITQSINQTTGELQVTFVYDLTNSVATNRPVLIVSGINSSLDWLQGRSAASSTAQTWSLPGLTEFRTDLWGYIECIRTSSGYTELVAYSQPVNATIPPLLRLQSATLSADGSTLRLVFNQTVNSTMMAFDASLISLTPCIDSSFSLLSLNSTFVDLTLSGGLCPGATLTLQPNITWSTQDWFYLSQSFSSISSTPLVFTEARLLNGSLLELYVPLETDPSDLFFDPSKLRLTCNGSATPATVYPNGTVTGCWPPLGVRLEILGAGALTDGVRELNETLVGTEWIVFVSSEANLDCPEYPPCPGPPGPKNRNNFFRLSIGWILGATLIPGFIGLVAGIILGLKLVPPIKYHLVPHDVYRVGDVYNDSGL